MNKDYDLYIDFVEGDKKGFEYYRDSHLSCVKFYYIDDSDNRKEWVRETHFFDCDDVYIDVVDKSEVPYHNEFPYYFKLETAKKSITAYLLFYQFKALAKQEKGCSLSLDTTNRYIDMTMFKDGKEYSHPFRTVECLATQKYSSLKTRFDEVFIFMKRKYGSDSI